MIYDILGVNFAVKICSLSILHEIESLLYNTFKISHVQQKGGYLFLWNAVALDIINIIWWLNIFYVAKIGHWY